MQDRPIQTPQTRQHRTVLERSMSRRPAQATATSGCVSYAAGAATNRCAWWTVPVVAAAAHPHERRVLLGAAGARRWHR